MLRLIFAAVFTVLVVAVPSPAPDTHARAQEVRPLSLPERSNYEETSRYDDVIQFFDELQKLTPLVRVQSFGKTNEGRELPLVIIADPPLAAPREARASEKPVLFVMANIHAGEVEGKESLQHLARRLTLGDLRPLVDQLVILFAPIYNADGNEKVTPVGRSRQNGPIGPVGQRANAQGFDLNRDYTKLEAPETRALVKLFNEWDPHVTVDLHTTNGSHHAYHLTYSIPLNPSIDPRLARYHREQMMPAIAKAMLDKHRLRTYYYGNFASADGRGGGPRASGRGGRGRGRGRRGRRGGDGERGEATAQSGEGARAERPGERGDNQAVESGAQEGERGAAGERRGEVGRRVDSEQSARGEQAGRGAGATDGPPRLRQWRAFSQLPRVGQNYVGFRNRLTILSEAYSYVDFKGRIDATAAFVEEIMRYAINHADEIRVLTRQADFDLVRGVLTDGPPRIGVEYEQRPLPEPVEILVGEVRTVVNPRTERNMTAMIEDAVTPERMQDYGIFAATRQVPAAHAYVFAPEEGLQPIVDKLRAHGIAVEELTQPLKAETSVFRIANANRSARSFEGHNEVSLAGTFETEEIELPAGTIFVRTAQPLGRLAAYLLEPETDDGFVTWNYLDEYVGAGKIYPIRKIMQPVTAAARVVTD
jgi:hypothetical protein